MFKNPFKIALLAVCLLFAGPAVNAQQVKEPTDTDPEWSKNYQPFQIVGNLYYVGTYDLACYLVTTPKGHILINTGLASSASQIKANVEKLGFKFADIKILLTTQAHYDHLGAMATIKKMTGAKMMVDEKDAKAMADGGISDYAFGGKMTFAPIQPDQLLRNNDKITLGNMQLTMLHHPGHTKGSCSFLLNVKDKTKTYRVLIANMPSIVTEKKFSEVKSYPSISKDYAYTLSSLKKQTFDIWLSSHASQFDLHAKHKPGDAYNPKAFIDRKGYDETLADLQKAYDKKLLDH